MNEIHALVEAWRPGEEGGNAIVGNIFIFYSFLSFLIFFHFLFLFHLLKKISKYHNYEILKSNAFINWLFIFFIIFINCVLDILFGDVIPTGKLTLTFPFSGAQIGGAAHPYYKKYRQV